MRFLADESCDFAVIPSVRKQIAKDVVKLVKRQGERLIGGFITVQPGRIRITHVPGE
jgi:hypothetical protein